MSDRDQRRPPGKHTGKPFRSGGPRKERGGDARPQGERAAFRDHPRSDKPAERPFKARGDKPFKPRGDKPFRSGEDRVPHRGARTEGERPFKSERPHGGRFKSAAERHDRPQGERAFKSRDDKPRDDKAFRPASAPYRGERSGERPSKSAGERPLYRGGERTPHEGKRPFKKKTWRPAGAKARDGAVLLFGWHSVKAALENPARKFFRLLASDNAAKRLSEDIDLTARLEQVKIEVVTSAVIEQMVGSEAVHQGLLAECEPLEGPDIEDLDPKGLVLVLDQITDPHNVGAMLRTAAAFGVEAVITTERHSPETTGVLAKAASGALEYVPIVTVVNLARAMEVLKDKGVFIVGLDSAGDRTLTDAPMRAPLALVLGAEGKGLRHLTRTNCDVVARLDLPGRIKSLNVSNATALALHVAMTKLEPAADDWTPVATDGGDAER